MPQMSPLSWLSLFFFFILIFLILNAVLFFSFKYSSMSDKPSQTGTYLNWKW